MIRLLIADDHPVVRSGLRQILAAEKDIDVVGEAENAAEVMSQLYNLQPQVLLLDVTMPGRSGLEALAGIKQQYPRVAVLVLSMYPEDQIAVRALKAGASGYLNKETAPEMLVAAIRTVAGGRKYVTPAVAEALAQSLDSTTGKPPHETLSDREFQVLKMIASGKTVSEIGDELALSVKTVSTYRTRILEKMSMKTNAELTRYAVVNRLVD